MVAPRRSTSRLSQKRVSLLHHSYKEKRREEIEKQEAEKRKRRPIKINVQILTGRTLTISVSPDDTIEQLTFKIQSKEGINPDQQRLLYNGLRLHEGDTVEECRIQENGTLFLTLRNRGG